jgi:hypothetical protein
MKLSEIMTQLLYFKFTLSGEYDLLEGQGHEMEFNILSKIKNFGLNKSLYWPLNFGDEIFMSCRLCHLPPVMVRRLQKMSSVLADQ